MIQPHQVLLAKEGGGLAGELKLVDGGVGLLGAAQGQHLLGVEAVVGEIPRGVPQHLVAPALGGLLDRVALVAVQEHDPLVGVGRRHKSRPLTCRGRRAG